MKTTRILPALLAAALLAGCDTVQSVAVTHRMVHQQDLMRDVPARIAALPPAADKAFAYIERGPMADWNWEGQFEDIRPASGRWRNLTKHPACSVAMYLLRRFPGDRRRTAPLAFLSRRDFWHRTT